MPSKNLEEQAAEADRLHREAYPDLYTNDQPEDAEEEKTAPGTEEEQVEQAPEEQAATPEQPTTDAEDYQHKYSVLKGKYDSEVPRLTYELGELKRQLAELTAATAKPKTVTEDASDEEDPAIKMLRDEYPDVYTAVNKLLDKKVPSSKIEERINRIEASQVQTAEERFVSDLNRLAPDWDSINRDSRFVEWLNMEDPLTGYTRMALASAAQNGLDGRRVAAFYNEFKKTIEQVSNATVEETASDSKKKRMENFVAPPKTSSAAPNTKQKEDTVTKDFISKFYDEAAKGRYMGRMEEFNKIEAKINKAMAEGKIID